MKYETSKLKETRDMAVNCVLDPSLCLGLEGQTDIKAIFRVIREI